MTLPITFTDSSTGADGSGSSRTITRPPVIATSSVSTTMPGPVISVRQGRPLDALDLLEEAAPMRLDLAAAAAGDADLLLLHSDPRFQAIVKPT